MIETVSSKLKKVILPLYSALVKLHLKCWIKVWAPKYKTDMELLKQVHWRAIKITKGLEHLTFEEAERVGTV